MRVKEKEEIIEVLKKLIKYIEDNLTDSIYLCNSIKSLGIYDGKGNYTYFKVCGWNRMVGEAVEYIKSERPTKIRNKEIFHQPYYDRDQAITRINNPWWRYYMNTTFNYKEVVMAINMEKIRFLKHLIIKLKR